MSQTSKSFQVLSKRLSDDPNLLEQYKEDPISMLQKEQTENPLTYDRWIYRVIVLSLGLTVITTVVGIIFLMNKGPIGDQNIPTILTALASGAIGAIAGLLAPPPKNQAE